MSCFSEEEEAKKRQWCGVYEKCARIYIFFKALGINPMKVGFYNNDILSAKKDDLYVIFNKASEKSAYGGSSLGRDKQLLAFYLAFRRGVNGELMKKFKSLHLAEVEKRKYELVKKYFGIHSSFSLPSTLRKKVLRIFEKEQELLKPVLQRLLGNE